MANNVILCELKHLLGKAACVVVTSCVEHADFDSSLGVATILACLRPYLHPLLPRFPDHYACSLPKARDDGLVTVDMGPPELDGPKVPTTLPTNADGVVLEEPIKVF